MKICTYIHPINEMCICVRVCVIVRECVRKRERDTHTHDHKTHERQIKQRNQLSLTDQDDCRTKRTQSNAQNKIEQTQKYSN